MCFQHSSHEDEKLSELCRNLHQKKKKKKSAAEFFSPRSALETPPVLQRRGRTAGLFGLSGLSLIWRCCSGHGPNS